MYFIVLSLLFFSATLKPSDAPSKTITIQTVNAQQPKEGFTKARDTYLTSLYAPIAHHVEQILDALTLTNKSGFQRKILRLLSLGSKAVSATAHGSYALSTPFFDNPEFADSYLKRPLHALTAWNALRRAPKIAALLAHDTSFAKKLTRLPPHILKEISRNRIKTALLQMIITFALLFAVEKVTDNKDARIAYRTLLRGVLHKILVDKSNTYPRLEAAVLKEIQKDREREDAVNVRDIVSEVKLAAASGGKNKK